VNDDCINVMHATFSSSNQSSVTIRFLLTIDATESILVNVGEVSSSFVTPVASDGFCRENRRRQGKVRLGEGVVCGVS
jgi:hypothetical protein